VIGSLGLLTGFDSIKGEALSMTTDQFERVLEQTTSTNKVLSLLLSKTSNESQRNTLRPN